MNKAQLVEAIADKVGGRQQAADAVDAVLDAIVRAVVAGERVSVTGFGSFEKVDRPARYARNPQTGERVRVKKTSVPRFRAGQGFKDLVSGSKKLPKRRGRRQEGPQGQPHRRCFRACCGKKAAAKKAAAKKAAAKKARQPHAKKAPAKKAAHAARRPRPPPRRPRRRRPPRRRPTGQEGPGEEGDRPQDHRQEEPPHQQEVSGTRSAHAPGRAPFGSPARGAFGRGLRIVRAARGQKRLERHAGVIAGASPSPLDLDPHPLTGPQQPQAPRRRRPRRRKAAGCRRRAAHCRCGSRGRTCTRSPAWPAAYCLADVQHPGPAGYRRPEGRTRRVPAPAAARRSSPVSTSWRTESTPASTISTAPDARCRTRERATESRAQFRSGGRGQQGRADSGGIGQKSAREIGAAGRAPGAIPRAAAPEDRRSGAATAAPGARRAYRTRAVRQRSVEPGRRGVGDDPAHPARPAPPGERRRR